MAQFVKSPNRPNSYKQLIHLLMVGVLSVVIQTSAHAQEIKDPTRPPGSISPAGETLQTSIDPVLQSVLIAPNRKLAIIDGQTVKLYAKFGDQTLVKITETSVVLKRGAQLQTLNLHPDFSKKLIQSTSSSK